MRRLALLLALLPLAPARAEEDSPVGAVLDRAVMREQILDGQHRTAEGKARLHALFAYRAARAQHFRFTTQPKDRLARAQDLDRALLALAASHAESKSLGEEWENAKDDHVRLERAFLNRSLSGVGTKPRSEAPVRFARPVRGTPVSVPGKRVEGSGKIELGHMDVKWLAKLNEPVKAIAPGVIKRVEPLIQGGFVVVTAHPSGYTSILEGMRDVLVKAGDPVSTGQPLGLTGRNLDGAAVVSLEIWHRREPLDPGRLLAIRL